jgi:hypothetical protein
MHGLMARPTQISERKIWAWTQAHTMRPVSPRPIATKRYNFLYLICHDFRKINGPIKFFDKCASGTVPHGGRLLPPYPTALSPCRRGACRQETGSCARAGSTAPGPCRRAAWRQVRTAVPQGGRGFFSFWFLKHF